MSLSDATSIFPTHLKQLENYAWLNKQGFIVALGNSHSTMMLICFFFFLFFFAFVEKYSSPDLDYMKI